MLGQHSELEIFCKNLLANRGQQQLHLIREDGEFTQTDILGSESDSLREAGVMLSEGQINPQVKVMEDCENSYKKQLWR